MKLQAIRDMLIDERTKGMPGGITPFPLSAIGEKGWNVLAGDLPLPLMVLKRSALSANAAVFRDYLAERGLSFAPHGKTTMAPQIFAEQLAAGAWGMTAATINQAQVMRYYGVKRIILANQLLGRAHLDWIGSELADPDFDFYAYVDSPEQFDLIEAHFLERPPAGPLKLLVEIGIEGGRTGFRSAESALALIATIASSDPAHFRFAGLAGFEGVAPHQDAGTATIEAFLDQIATIAEAVPSTALDGMDEIILSAGGSSHFDLVADRFSRVAVSVPVRIVLRSGCYVTHDSGAYDAAQNAALADPRRHWSRALRPALEALAYVQSMPEPGLAFLTMGKRDVPYDAGLPVPHRRWRVGTGWAPAGAAKVFATNDQHAYVRLGADCDWRIGDIVACGISHPCTAFDKWRLLPVIDDDYNVIDGIATFF